MRTSEKRHHIRYQPKSNLRIDFYYDVETKVAIEKKETGLDKACKYSGISRNFSVHGMCFASSMNLQRGEHLNLEVFLPLEHTPIKMEGRVCWSEESRRTANQFNTGVEIFSVEGKNVDDTVYHDDTYNIEWSEVLESVLGKYRILAQQQKDNANA